MKNLKSYIGLMLLSLGMASCSNEFDRPPLVLPEADIEANTTILELKELYWQDGANYATQIGKKSNGDNIIIEGIVTSSDESGNIFKNLMITDGTAALTISIDEYDLYTSYALGQKVVIDLTDMYIGKYSGLVQLGIPEETEKYGTQISRMTIEEFKAHAQQDGMPMPDQVEAIDFDLGSLSTDAAFMRQWQSRLIKLSGVTFADGGTATFAESKQSVSRTLTDENGKSIIVYNSGYSDFYDQTLPAGKGDVVGILSYFGNNWQLLLRSEEDCMNFEEVPEAPVDPVDGINEGFDSGAIPSGWTTALVSGTKKWYVTDFDSNYYASCTAYKGTDPEDGKGYDSWLITPPIDADKLAEKAMHFQSQAAYSGDCALEVYVMTDNDPTTATLTKLNANIAEPPASGYSGFVTSGNIDLSSFSGIIYIGFRYTAKTSSASRTYCIDNVVVGQSTSETPSTPDQPSTPTDAVNSLNEGFDSGAIPTGWTSALVAGNKEWYVTDFDSNYYAACTAYKGTDGEGYDAWLITPAINADNLAEKVMHFKSQAAYSGNSALEVYVLTSSDVNTATKTKLNPTIATAPEKGYSGFVSSGNIDLSSFSGVIYVGFRYIAETSSASHTYCIDDVVVGQSSSDTPSTPDQPDEPETPTTGNTADFNTMNDGSPKSSYASYTSATGWVATNCALLSGDDNGGNTNPQFAFIGSSSTFAPTLNGKTSAPGSLVSPTLSGGLKTLTFNYGFAFTDTNCSITINIKQNGAVVASETLERTDMAKQEVYDYTMNASVSGDFVIEIVNNCPSAVDKNKDRVSIWNLTWTN